MCLTPLRNLSTKLTGDVTNGALQPYRWSACRPTRPRQTQANQTKSYLPQVKSVQSFTGCPYFDLLMEIHVMPDRWLSVEEIAVYLGVSKDTVYAWISKRNMPAHRIGRLWKFKSEEVDEWVRSGGAAENDGRGKE